MRTYAQLAAATQQILSDEQTRVRHADSPALQIRAREVIDRHRARGEQLQTYLPNDFYSTFEVPSAAQQALPLVNDGSFERLITAFYTFVCNALFVQPQ